MPRRRPNHRLPFTGRVIATLVIMRFQLPHAALAVFCQVDRSTLTRAVSGKRKQNTGKSTVGSDGEGRLLWQGAFRPGRMHDVTALRTEGIEDLLHRHPDVRAKVDSGYQGMARDFPNQVTAPPKKPGKDASADEIGAWETERKAQSSARICRAGGSSGWTISLTGDSRPSTTSVHCHRPREAG